MICFSFRTLKLQDEVRTAALKFEQVKINFIKRILNFTMIIW